MFRRTSYRRRAAPQNRRNPATLVDTARRSTSGRALNLAGTPQYAIMTMQHTNPGATWLRRGLQSSTGHAKVQLPC